jgi:hypothetical protein
MTRCLSCSLVEDDLMAMAEMIGSVGGGSCVDEGLGEKEEL